MLADLILLLTATIDPRDCTKVARRDPALRLLDYMESLRRWLLEPAINEIILCENSGSSLKDLIGIVRLHNRLGKNVQFISYNTTGDGHRGKGYGEAGIIQHTISACALSESRKILKVSGRYHITNVASLVDNISSAAADVVSCPFIVPGWIPSECFCVSVAFLNRYLCAKRGLMNDSNRNPFEQVFADAVKEAVDDGLKHSIFGEHPQIEGISGGSGIPWHRTYFATAPIVNRDGSFTIRDGMRLRVIDATIRGYLKLYSHSPARDWLRARAIHLLIRTNYCLEAGLMLILRDYDLTVIEAVMRVCLQPDTSDHFYRFTRLTPRLAAQITRLIAYSEQCRLSRQSSEYGLRSPLCLD